jgi:hypothetical protein
VLSRKISFTGELKVGDVLTATTIIISLISVLVSWSIDRSMRLRAQADEIRSAAASTLADVERWRDLAFSLYTEAQPVFVEASETATSSNPTPVRRLEAARDLLWKRLNEIHNAIMKKILDERLDKGYAKLFGYYPEVRSLYQKTLMEFRRLDDEMVKEFLGEVQMSVLAFENAEPAPATADVGNALRSTADRVKEKHMRYFLTSMKTSESFLVQKIESNDNDLLRTAKHR